MTPRHRALQTPLLKILGCELPIMLAGMGGVARHELAAAVSQAGGFGVLGMVREPVALIHCMFEPMSARLASSCSRKGIKPAATDTSLLKAQVDACLALKVPAMVLFWEVDVALVRHLKEEGVQVIHQVGNQKDADDALTAGADVLIVQGHEAGGHVRGTTSIFSLLPQIASQSPVPVVASGGIGNGRALVAALALGAQGVSLGTALLATNEANAHDYHKQRVLQANADDTIYTTRFNRNWHEVAPVRVLANDVLAGRYDNADRDTVIGQQDNQPIYLFSTDSPLKGATGQIEDMAIYCGQSCGQIHQQCSAGERIAKILLEAHETLREFEDSSSSR